MEGGEEEGEGSGKKGTGGTRQDCPWQYAETLNNIHFLDS